MEQQCDVCGCVLWHRPHEMIVGVTPATAGRHIYVCDQCRDEILTVRSMINSYLNNGKEVESV